MASGEGRQQALLRWAVENSPLPVGDAPAISEEEWRARGLRKPQEIAPEWYDALFGKSDVEVMRELLNVLKDGNLEQRREAAEKMCFMVELTHNATDLPKIGGLDMVWSLLKDSDEELKIQALWILAKSASNNPEFQAKCVAGGFVGQIIAMLNSDKSFKVRAKALHALSAVVRHSAEAQTMIEKERGLEAVLGLLKSTNDINIQTRAVFFIGYLIEAQSDARQIIFQLGGIGMFERILEVDSFDLREKSLVAMESLFKTGGSEIQKMIRKSSIPKILEHIHNQESNRVKESEDYPEEESLLPIIRRVHALL